MSDLSLEKMRVNERLAGVEGSLLKLTEQIISLKDQREACFRRCEEQWEKHDDILNGNSHDGLAKIVDRLVQTEQSRRWNYRMIWTTLLGLGITQALEWVKKR